MNKAIGIGGAFVLFCVTLIGRFNGLITDDFLIISAIVVFFMCVSYIVSWGATQAYKVLNFKPATWAKDTIKRKIYAFAIWTGGLTMLACGSFFLLADLTSREKAVISILWGLACVFVGLTSPFLWRFMFDNVIPRLKRWAKGRGETGNEALDRPSEVPRD